MYIPNSVIKEATELLDGDIDNSLQMLGEELYRIEFRQSGRTLGSDIPAQDLRQKAENYIAKKRDILKNVICEKWKDKKREDFLDASKLLASFIALIAEALDLSITYIAIAMSIAVIIIKRGIDKFCSDVDTPDEA